MRIVQLFSGGFDSVGQAILLHNRGHTIHPLYIAFRSKGGKQVKEIRIAQHLAEACDLHPLTTRTFIIGRDDRYQRNRIFCKLAGEYAKKVDADAIAIGTSMFDGTPEYANFPPEDITPDLLQAEAGIQTLVLQMHKAGLLRALPQDLKTVLFSTTSCQMWYKNECGRCYMCIERHAAFIVALGYDHTIYTHDPKATALWTKMLKQETAGYDEEPE